MNFFEELQNCYCSSMVRQLKFGEYLNGRNWNLDLKVGIVKFGEDLVFPIQVLGSFSELSGTWMWSWENPGASGWNKKILKGVKKLKKLGDIFESETFELGEELTGHHIAMVCSHLLGDVPYYRGPYQHGAIFFTILDVPIDLNPKISCLQCINTMMDAISSCVFIENHKEMVENFLTSQKFVLNEYNNDGKDFIKAKRDEDEVIIEFNEDGFIKSASSVLTSSSTL